MTFANLIDTNNDFLETVIGFALSENATDEFILELYGDLKPTLNKNLLLERLYENNISPNMHFQLDANTLNHTSNERLIDYIIYGDLQLSFNLMDFSEVISKLFKGISNEKLLKLFSKNRAYLNCYSSYVHMELDIIAINHLNSLGSNASVAQYAEAINMAAEKFSTRFLELYKLEPLIVSHSSYVSSSSAEKAVLNKFLSSNIIYESMIEVMGESEYLDYIIDNIFELDEDTIESEIKAANAFFIRERVTKLDRPSYYDKDLSKIETINTILNVMGKSIFIYDKKRPNITSFKYFDTRLYPFFKEDGSITHYDDGFEYRVNKGIGKGLKLLYDNGFDVAPLIKEKYSSNPTKLIIELLNSTDVKSDWTKEEFGYIFEIARLYRLNKIYIKNMDFSNQLTRNELDEYKIAYSHHSKQNKLKANRNDSR